MRAQSGQCEVTQNHQKMFKKNQWRIRIMKVLIGSMVHPGLCGGLHEYPTMFRTANVFQHHLEFLQTFRTYLCPWRVTSILWSSAQDTHWTITWPGHNQVHLIREHKITRTLWETRKCCHIDMRLWVPWSFRENHWLHSSTMCSVGQHWHLTLPGVAKDDHCTIRNTVLTLDNN